MPVSSGFRGVGNEQMQYSRQRASSPRAVSYSLILSSYISFNDLPLLPRSLLQYKVVHELGHSQTPLPATFLIPPPHPQPQCSLHWVCTPPSPPTSASQAIAGPKENHSAVIKNPVELVRSFGIERKKESKNTRKKERKKRVAGKLRRLRVREALRDTRWDWNTLGACRTSG